MEDEHIASYANQPMHESVTSGASHNYINLQELEASNSLPVLAGIKRQMSPTSLSSESEESDTEDQVPEMMEIRTVVGELKAAQSHVRTESKDSFYESDKEELSFSSTPRSDDLKPSPREKPPLKAKPQVKSRPVPLPRKQDSVTSYENEDAIELLKEHEDAIKASQENKTESMAVTSQLELSYDYDSSTLTSLEVKPRERTSDQGRESPEIFDYENDSLAPLPSYDQAVAGDAEFFDMDELEGPPVPARDDSRMVMSAKSGSDSSSAEEVNLFRVLTISARLVWRNNAFNLISDVTFLKLIF